MEYQEIIDKIKSLEIQGARNIAIAAAQAFGLKLKETDDPEELQKAHDELVATRATEPGLRNALKFCIENYKDDPKIAEKAVEHFAKSKEKIAEYGAKKIHDGMKVFTHCHSSTARAIIEKAWDEGKRFEVYNTETRPKFQGRKTATKLAAKGIPVTHFVDSAGRSMLRKCDLFLFGCDAVTAEGKLINKIGTEMLAEAAHESRIDAYSCTNAWKFNAETLYGEEEEIEQRDTKEVWEDPPEGVKIYNPAFEITSPDMFTGVITELGIYKGESLIEAVKEEYPWMFK
ncbi:translation initiation factor eIF-2B [Patescibacteria group bacterium]